MTKKEAIKELRKIMKSYKNITNKRIQLNISYMDEKKELNLNCFPVNYLIEAIVKKEKKYEKIKYNIIYGILGIARSYCEYMDCQIGSLTCEDCDYFIKHNTKKQYVKCSYKSTV
jgi:hypothetical protein